MTAAMVETNDLDLEIRDMTRDELAALAGSALGELAQAELKRRDDLARARQRRRNDPVTAEWYLAAQAQFAEAESACRGYLLNAAGEARGMDPWLLWQGPMWQVEKWASWELLRFWETSPRCTVTDYRNQVQLDREREQDERDDQLADHAAGHVRHGSQASPGQPVSGAGPVRDAGPVRRPGHAMTEPVVLTEQNPVIVIPGPAAEFDQAEAAIARLRARQAQLRAELGRPAADPEPSPPPPPVVTGTVAVRSASPVVATGGRAEVSGAGALGYVRAYIGQYASLTPSQLDVATLWAAHSHVRESDGRLAWRATPRLAMLSSDPGSGKSRVLELLARLCPHNYGLDTEPSAAGLAHTISAEHATVTLDEADVLFGSGKRREAVRAIINSGYTASGTVLKMRGSKAERARIFGPLAFAGLDCLETGTGDALAALLSRCIAIRMTRATRVVPDLDDAADRAGAILNKALAIWCADNRAALLEAEPWMPDGVRGRAAQIWQPLLSIADQVGGDWPDRARAACRELTVRGGIADDFSTGAFDELEDLAASWGSF